MSAPRRRSSSPAIVIEVGFDGTVRYELRTGRRAERWRLRTRLRDRASLERVASVLEQIRNELDRAVPGGPP